MSNNFFKNLKIEKVSFFNKNFLFYIILLLLASLSFFKLNINSDEGVVLSGAWHLLNGRRFYYDIFSYIAPGSFYFLYFLWKIFGVSYFLVKFLSFLLLFFSGIGLYKIINLIENKNFFSFLLPILFVFFLIDYPVVNHNFFSIFIIIYSIYFFLLFLKKKNNKFLLFSGFLAGLSVIFLQQRGLAFFAGSFIYLLINLFFKRMELKNIIYYLLSFVVPMFLFLFWPVKLIFYDLIYFPFFNYMEINKFYNPFFLYFFIFLYLFLFFIFLKQKTKKDSIWYLFLVQLFLFLSTFSLPDVYHLLTCSFPLTIIFVYFLKKVFFKNKKGIKFLFIFLIFFLVLSKSFLMFYVFLNNKKNDFVNIIEKECKSEYMYVGPFMPHYYFKFKKINPTSFDVLFTNHNTEEQFELAKKQIIEKNPDCGIFYLKGGFKKFKYNRENSVFKYFEDNYDLIYNKDNILLYKKYE